MRKLRLDPEALSVASFDPQPQREPERGTVQANNTGVYSCGATCFCPSHHATECTI